MSLDTYVLAVCPDIFVAIVYDTLEHCSFFLRYFLCSFRYSFSSFSLHTIYTQFTNITISAT